MKLPRKFQKIKDSILNVWYLMACSQGRLLESRSHFIRKGELWSLCSVMRRTDATIFVNLFVHCQKIFIQFLLDLAVA